MNYELLPQWKERDFFSFSRLLIFHLFIDSNSASSLLSRKRGQRFRVHVRFGPPVTVFCACWEPEPRGAIPTILRRFVVVVAVAKCYTFCTHSAKKSQYAQFVRHGKLGYGINWRLSSTQGWNSEIGHRSNYSAFPFSAIAENCVSTIPSFFLPLNAPLDPFGFFWEKNWCQEKMCAARSVNLSLPLFLPLELCTVV